MKEKIESFFEDMLDHDIFVELHSEGLQIYIRGIHVLLPFKSIGPGATNAPDSWRKFLAECDKAE